MSISFVRIDDRVIHGQLVTRWAKELPCDGIVAIDDAVAADPLLSSVMKGAVRTPKSGCSIPRQLSKNCPK